MYFFTSQIKYQIVEATQELLQKNEETEKNSAITSVLAWVSSFKHLHAKKNSNQLYFWSGERKKSYKNAQVTETESKN